jgi:hypothetical protein
VLSRETVVAHRDVGERLAAAQHEVRQRTRDERCVGLDERHFDRAIAPHRMYFAAGRAAVAAADDHDLRRAQALPIEAQHRKASERAAARARRAGCTKEIASSHRVASYFAGFCAANQPASAVDLLVGVALRQLIHDGCGACARLELLHLAQRFPRAACRRAIRRRRH